MDASCRSEENWERCSLPTDQAGVVATPAPQKTQENKGQKKVNSVAVNIPAKQNSASEHCTHYVVQALARPSAVIPMMEGGFGDLIARSVAAAMTPSDAQLKMLQSEIVAMKSLEGINGTDGMGDI